MTITQTKPAHTATTNNSTQENPGPLWGNHAVYSVYIHYMPDENLERLICWERRESTTDKEKALEEARILHQSYAHNRIEVKKCYHSPKCNKRIDETIKVFGDNEIESISNPLKIALGILACALAVLFTYGLWFSGTINP